MYSRNISGKCKASALTVKINDGQFIIWWAKGIFLWRGGGDKIITNHFILTLNHDNASLHDSYNEYFRDVVKLTAQFVARNGRQFLTNLMNREQRNYQFDFLRPQHSLFNYFTKLVEQYTKVCPTVSSIFEIGLMTCSLYQRVIS